MARDEGDDRASSIHPGNNRIQIVTCPDVIRHVVVDKTRVPAHADSREDCS